MIKLFQYLSERRLYVNILSDFEEKSVSISINQSDKISIDEHKLSLLVNSEIMPRILFSVEQFFDDSSKLGLKFKYRSEKGELLKAFLGNHECDLTGIILQYCDFIIDNDEKYISDCLTEISNVFIEDNQIFIIEVPFKIKQDAFSKIDIFCGFIDEVSSISSSYEQKLRILREELANDNFTKEKVSDLLNKSLDAGFDKSDNTDSSDVKPIVDNAKEASEAFKKACPNCGAVCNGKQVFCIKCGTNLKSNIKDKAENKNVLKVEKLNETDRKKTNEKTQSFEEVMNSNISVLKHGISCDKSRRIHTGKVKAIAAHKYVSENDETELAEDNKNSAAPEASILDKGSPSANESPDVSEQKNKDANSGYAETTLLGFTNFGETTVLDSSAVFGNTPNIVRLSTGEKIYITKRNFLIGKSRSKVDYTVENNEVISRIHCEISVVGNDYYIIDKGSTNGTYLNGSKIQSQTAKKISDSDEIKLANEVFKFYVQ